MSVLDTLEIRFEANLMGVTEKLNGLADVLSGMGERGFTAGQALAGGLADGIAAGIDRVRNAAKALYSAAAGGVKNEIYIPQTGREESRYSDGLPQVVADAVKSAVSGFEVKVPIVVDSVKLGEAAIRGINQVTKNTGMHLLNI